MHGVVQGAFGGARSGHRGPRRQRLNEDAVSLQWHEVNGAHAFLRDEGPRYDPALASLMYNAVLTFFARTLR